VVGKARWQAAALTRAQIRSFGEVELPVLCAADLVLFKLYAGGPQDAWDIVQLLAAADEAQLTAEIERRLNELPSDAARHWQRIRG
jgi:hypothetical protein